MTEILTESFCERCGTRYTFESSVPRKSRVGRVKVFSKGIRNFVMTDDSSFSEAMAEARSAEEQLTTSHQLDAFHQTFNFCLDCRQYTCGSCWNTHEGRCLTCAPDPTLEPAAEAAAVAGATSVEETIPADAWPETDVPVDRLARVVGDTVPPDGIASAAAGDAVETEPEAVEVHQDAEAIARAAALVAASNVAADEPERAQGAPVKGLVPGQSLDEAIAAWEAQQLADDAAAEPQPELAAAERELEPEPVAAAEPEPFAEAEPSRSRSRSRKPSLSSSRSPSPQPSLSIAPTTLSSSPPGPSPPRRRRTRRRPPQPLRLPQDRPRGSPWLPMTARRCRSGRPPPRGRPLALIGTHPPPLPGAS